MRLLFIRGKKPISNIQANNISIEDLEFIAMKRTVRSRAFGYRGFPGLATIVLLDNPEMPHTIQKV